MIIRIMGEGQFEVPDAGVDELNQLDTLLEAAIAADDEPAFRAALASLLDRARELGVRLADDVLVPSEAVLPAADIDLAQIHELLGDQGLIPG